MWNINKLISINAYCANVLNYVSDFCSNCSHLQSPNVVLLKRERGKPWVGDESLVVDGQNVPVPNSNPRKSPEMWSKFFLYFSVITPLTQSMSSMHCNGGTLSDTFNISVLYWFQWMIECDWFNDSLLWHWPQNRRWQHWSQYVKVSLPHFWLISVHFTHNAFHTSHICQILRPAMHISHSRWTSFQLLRQMGWNRWK